MRCIREIIELWTHSVNLQTEMDVFDVRLKNEIPDTSYDIYISSGGPGDPLVSRFEDWDIAWCRWVDEMERWNNNPATHKKNISSLFAILFNSPAVILMQVLCAKEDPQPLVYSRFICWKRGKRNLFLMDLPTLFMPWTAGITR